MNNETGPGSARATGRPGEPGPGGINAPEMIACRSCGTERPGDAEWILVPSGWGPIPVCWACWSLPLRDGGWLEASARQLSGEPHYGTAACRDTRHGGPFSGRLELAVTRLGSIRHVRLLLDAEVIDQYETDADGRVIPGSRREKAA